MLAASALRDEAVVTSAQARLAAAELAVARGERDLPTPASVGPPVDQPPRARLADALLSARRAALAPSAHPADLARARALSADATAARPRWGDAWAVRAYAAALSLGESSAITLALLAHSYADAPFLASTAAWRVRVGLTEWDRLDRQTRRRVAEEAVWLAESDGERRRAVFALARESGGYRTVLLRWRAMRAAAVDRPEGVGAAPSEPRQE